MSELLNSISAELMRLLQRASFLQPTKWQLRMAVALGGPPPHQPAASRIVWLGPAPRLGLVGRGLEQGHHNGPDCIVFGCIWTAPSLAGRGGRGGALANGLSIGLCLLLGEKRDK